MIIRNAKVFSDGCRFVEKDLIIREGRIVFGAEPLEGEEILDAKGAYALPGLVDIHFHGAVGHDFCDADEAGLQAIADFEASKGVLAICPATMTFSEEILNGIMDVAAAHKNERGADLVGINMEGPYISPDKVGRPEPQVCDGRRRRHVPPAAGPQRRADPAGGRGPRGTGQSGFHPGMPQRGTHLHCPHLRGL